MGLSVSKIKELEARRLERKLLRRAAIEAIAALKPEELTDWEVAAKALNKKRVRSELDRRWTELTLRRFMARMLKAGEAKASLGGGWCRRERRGVSAKRGLAEFVARVKKAAGRAWSYGEAAELLNAAGVPALRAGVWTAKLAKGFAVRHGDAAVFPNVGKEGRATAHKRAADVLRGMDEDRLLTWEQAADELNVRGVGCPGDGRWTKTKVVRFIDKHAEATGEKLLPWKHKEDGIRGCSISGIRERHARDVWANKVLAACGDVSDLRKAAERLNAAGIRTRLGNAWTGERLRVFLKLWRLRASEA